MPGTSDQRAVLPAILRRAEWSANGRATKRAVSDDFGTEGSTSQEDFGAQISSEGALLGSALGEARLDACNADRWFSGPRVGEQKFLIPNS